MIKKEFEGSNYLEHIKTILTAQKQKFIFYRIVETSKISKQKYIMALLNF